MSRARACAHALLWASLTAAAAAQEPSGGAGEGLTVVVVECERPAIDIGEVERVLHATLAPERARFVRHAGAEPATPPGGPVLWLDACSRPDVVVVRSQAEVAAPMAIHVLELWDVPPEGRARTVALALAELQDSPGYPSDAVPADTGEPSAHVAPATPPASSTPESGSASPARDVAARLAGSSGSPRAGAASASYGWSASAIGRHSLRAGPPLFGAAFGVWFERVQTQVLAAGNRQGDRLGHATFGFVALAVAYDVMTVGNALAFALRPRLEGGLAFAGGSAGGETTARTRSAYELQAAVLGEAELSTQLSSHVRLALALGGGAARGLDAAADDRKLGSTGGLVLAAALTLAGRL